MKQKGSGNSRKTSISLIFLSIFILSISLLLLATEIKKIPASDDLTDYVTDILSQCKTLKNQNLCYNDKISRLMDSPAKLSMEQAFNLIQLVQRERTSYMNCHILAHELSSKETAKDPNKWKEVILRCPNNVCNSGCSHGVFMERFKSEYLSDTQIDQIVPDLATACNPRADWHPSKSDVRECRHGLGHLGMYLTNADIVKSISLCKKINSDSANTDYEETCISAVFMQIFQPLDTDDVDLIKGVAPAKSQESVDEFCRRYSGTPYYACRKESWIYFWEKIRTPEGLIQFCSYTADHEEQEKCYAQMMNAITSNIAIKENDLTKLTDFCRQLPSQFQPVCFANAARRIVQINIKFMDKAIVTCQTAEQASSESGNRCYNLLIYYGGWIYNTNTKEYKDYCTRLPYSWSNKCLGFI